MPVRLKGFRKRVPVQAMPSGFIAVIVVAALIVRRAILGGLRSSPSP
jgi:hypothetical protein